jgi:hypothetical protein
MNFYEFFIRCPINAKANCPVPNCAQISVHESVTDRRDQLCSCERRNSFAGIVRQSRAGSVKDIVYDIDYLTGREIDQQ